MKYAKKLECKQNPLRHEYVRMRESGTSKGKLVKLYRGFCYWYLPEDNQVPSSNSREETNGTIVIASLTIICLLLPLELERSNHGEIL